MDVADFLEQLDELFELPAGTLNLDSIIEEAPGWSSLVFLGLIALIDETYGVQVKPRQIHDCVTVSDLFSLVAELDCSLAAV